MNPSVTTDCNAQIPISVQRRGRPHARVVGLEEKTVGAECALRRFVALRTTQSVDGGEERAEARSVQIAGKVATRDPLTPGTTGKQM